jgi:type I restriction enzyme R subunit
MSEACGDSSAVAINGLLAIKDHWAANVEIAPADLMHDAPFSDWGGVVAARKRFGAELNGILDELTEALAA